MRHFALFLTLSFLLSSCVQFAIGHTKVYGAATAVDRQDILSVIEAFERKGSDRRLKAYQVHVISADEMRVYWYKEPIAGGHDIYRRKADGWYYYTTVIVTS